MIYQFDCNLSFEKKGDLITMDFTFKGMVNVACDRCTTDIALPIDKSFRLWASFQNVKDNHERNESLDQEDWIFLEEKQDHIDLKQYLVDFSVLSIPTQFRYECREKEPYPCDENVLNQIGYFEVTEEKKESSSSIWKDLKSINWD